MSAPGIGSVGSRPRSANPPTAPAWVREAVGGDARESRHLLRGLTVHVAESKDVAFLRATVPDARDLSVSSLRRSVQRVYEALGEALRSRGLWPLRWWNYLPGIRERLPGGERLYEVFNVGRSEAYRRWYGSDLFGPRLAASTCVDHHGRDLVLHALASPVPGAPVENPRQTPSYRYSERYGRLPPSFSRAVLLEGSLLGLAAEHCAIVSGTASVVGEDSRHEGDFGAQLAETCRNLASLSAMLVAKSRSGPEADADAKAEDRHLSRYRDIRAYVVDEADAPELTAALERLFPSLARLEVVTANLCRPELLVEIEGVAAWDAGSDRPGGGA